MSAESSSAPGAPPQGPASRSTLGDVAALAGVSAKTASRALNEHAGVSPDTRQRVLDAARMLQFRPNGLAKELRAGAVSSGVGLVIADLANPFFSQMAAAAEKQLRTRGLELFIASTDEDADREREVVRTMLDRRVRALLVVPASEDHSYLQFEKSLGTPMVFLDRPPHFLSTDSVISDNRKTAFDAVRELAAAGHRRIGVVADADAAWTARERRAGAQAALESLGRPDWRDYVRTGAHEPGLARAAARELLSLPEPPTAILALNNLITHGVLMALRDTGIEVALLGFDDSDLAELLGVSVITFEPAELGRRAAEIAIARIDGLDAPPQPVVLPTRTIVRTPLSSPVRVASPLS